MAARKQAARKASPKKKPARKKAAATIKPQRKRERVHPEPGPEAGPASAPAGPRPLWSGTVTFALVSVPVDLYPATRDSAVRLTLLAPDGTPVEARYVCPEQDREVPWEEIARADETEEGFVVLTEEEVESAAPRRSRDIELTSFAPAEEITPLMVERTWVLTPAAGQTKPYRLLARALEEEGRAGMAKFVMRRRERLVAVIGRGGVLWAVTLRFRGEVRTPEEVGLPEADGASNADARAFRAALRDLRRDRWSSDELRDAEQESLRALVERKRRRGADVIEVEGAAEAADNGGAAAPELFDVIKSRMRAQKSAPRKRAPAKRSQAKQRTG